MKPFLSSLIIVLIVVGSAGTASASGPNGVDIGWSVNNDGTILLTPARCAALAQAGTGWLRVSMRLIPGHNTWDPAVFALYDTAVNNARDAGLQVILLIDGESWRGGQSAWTANNYENTGGDGDNDYMEGYANQAVVPIVQHFRDRTKIFELWNEPNAWTSNPSPGVYTGGSFVYPSNYAALLVDSWVAVHITNNNDVTLFFGGVFGHSIGGVYSYGRSGAQYIEDTYKIGINVTGSFTSVLANYGSYPLDGIGQHIYIDQGGLTTAAHIQQYLDWVRRSYTQFEGADTPKKVFITELGWTTKSVSADTQAADLDLSFQTIINGAPWVQSTIWFNWQDQNLSCIGSGVLCYGVVDSTGSPKRSYTPYQTYQSYEGRFADFTTDDTVLNYYNNLGKPALGNPYDNGNGAFVYAWGNGYAQDYDGGSHTTLVVMSSDFGTFEVNDQHGIRSFYLSNGSIDTFGFPTSNEYLYGEGTRQDFENGYITWDQCMGVVGH